uniref:Uncharacterized protein n=1 Tax=Amphimedon queenslandica TaxID=400682 RepID=A0A1X7V5R2_AMPQE
MQKALDHRSLVKKEREYYNDVRREAQLLLKGLYTDAANNYNPPLTRPLAMLNIVAHYSFDYAQQVHYRSSPLQAGPIYFLTPRICGIFGVCCEAIPQQVNFLINESFDTGKGANPVINMLNTKFSPDWCFGLLKQKFRIAEVDSLDDFVQVVEQSSAVKKAQPVGSSNSELIVETLDWSSYFATLFKKIKGIKGFQHFVVNATSPGVVAARQAVDGPVTQFNFLKEHAQIMEDKLPNILPPKGMSTERKWYLYKKIRLFCRYECKDITCPLPDAPRLTGSSRQSTRGVHDPPDLTMEIKVPHSPRQSLEPPATQSKCRERTDNKKVCEENTKIEVIASFTANQRTPSVTCDL